MLVICVLPQGNHAETWTVIIAKTRIEQSITTEKVICQITNTKASHTFGFIHSEHCWKTFTNPPLTTPSTFPLYFQYGFDYRLCTTWWVFKVSQRNRAQSVFPKVTCVFLSCIYSSICYVLIKFKTKKDFGIKTARDFISQKEKDKYHKI